mmetsp:Transcript_56883/g.138483  ORF Transcript_56883/g.138483 Transcript_56883/m.138483 type:complete len:1003 (-) Transcript_56883:733-3741(-)
MATKTATTTTPTTTKGPKDNYENDGSNSGSIQGNVGTGDESEQKEISDPNTNTTNGDNADAAHVERNTDDDGEQLESGNGTVLSDVMIDDGENLLQEQQPNDDEVRREQHDDPQNSNSNTRPISLSLSDLEIEPSSFETPPATPPPPTAFGASAATGDKPAMRDYDSGTDHGDRRRVYRRTILQEIQEVLPQSYMIFLIADLRLMSGTGRIRTRYETLAIDSDLVPRCTAKNMAVMNPTPITTLTRKASHDDGEEKLDDEEERLQLPSLKSIAGGSDHSSTADDSNSSKGLRTHGIPPLSKISRQSSRGESTSMIERASEGLSPRQVMAILLLELRDTFLTAKSSLEEEKADRSSIRKKGKNVYNSEHITEDFRNYRSNKKSKRNIEDSMESLLRAYARMISADLISEVESVKRRRETMARTSSVMMKVEGLSSPLSPMRESVSGAGASHGFGLFSPVAGSTSAPRPLIPASVMASIKEETEGYNDMASYDFDYDGFVDNDNDTSEIGVGVKNDNRRPGGRKSTSSNDGSEPSLQPPRGSSGILPTTMTSNTRPNDPSSDSEYGRSRRDYFTEYNLLNQSNRKIITDNLKERKKRVTQAYNDGVDAVLPQNREANTQKEFEELNNIIFEQTGEGSGQSVNASGFRPREMTRIMRKAVESRDDERLSFLSRLFKDGSVSQLMAETNARVVWINDWYPLKDLTYAIAVDKKLKRVLVVFRGAITSTDWKMVSKYTLEKIPNPVKDDYEGKKARLRVFQGFYTYLFRRRMDTGSNKYEEISDLVHKYGTERIGEDYSVFVTGHSLGAGLSVFFSFFASTDERFTKNGPVKAIAFAGPYCGGHSFTDAFRYQERSGKLMFARVHNNNDPVPYMPFNFRIGGRGCLWRHIGVGVVLPPIPWFRRWKPRVTYNGKEKSWASSTLRAYRNNVLFHFPWWQAWNFAKMHTLFELQDRIMYGAEQDKAGGDFHLLNKTFEELYEDLATNDYMFLKKEGKTTQSEKNHSIVN